VKRKDRRGAKRAIPPGILAEAAERHAGGETYTSLVRWLEKAHGLAVSIQCVSESIRRLREAPAPRDHRREDNERTTPAADYSELTEREGLVRMRNLLLDAANAPDIGAEALARIASSYASVSAKITALDRMPTAPTEDERAGDAAEVKRRLAAMRERVASPLPDGLEPTHAPPPAAAPAAETTPVLPAPVRPHEEPMSAVSGITAGGAGGRLR
jgi:hypothetical protein